MGINSNISHLSHLTDRDITAISSNHRTTTTNNINETHDEWHTLQYINSTMPEYHMVQPAPKRISWTGNLR